MQKSNKSQSREGGSVTVLRQLRESAKLTREQLLARMHNCVALSTWARWESGVEPSMTKEEWVLFCEAISVPFDQLPPKLSVPVSPGDLN
jgi:transcriptional regulator with XRE-family HTH domain